MTSSLLFTGGQEAETYFHEGMEESGDDKGDDEGGGGDEGDDKGDGGDKGDGMGDGDK